MYKYRLKYRPVGIGCQPNGYINHEELDKKETGFWGELTYNRPLSEAEIYKFELVPVADYCGCISRTGISGEEFGKHTCNSCKKEVPNKLRIM